MKDLRITIVQTTQHWEDKAANIAHFTAMLAQLQPGDTDLIVLPEMFTTGFTMNAAPLAEPMDGPTVKWLQGKAQEKKCVITGSFIATENGHYYNRLVWMGADGTYETYDKRHLFRMAHEEHTYTPGNKKLIVTLNGWRICPLVCYDLRFPVWSRNRNDYDLLIYIANWPERREYAWKHLLIARSIENQCYTTGVNRIGSDGNGIVYSGDSALLNFKGDRLNKTLLHQESLETVTLSYAELAAFRQLFPAAMDADDFELKI